MTPKQYLSRARCADNQVNALLEERARLWELATKTSSQITGMPGGGSGDTAARAVERLVQLEGNISAQIDDYVRVRIECDGVISAVGDGTLEAVLRLRYLAGLSWDDIADRLHYTRRHVTRLHGIALLRVTVSCP